MKKKVGLIRCQQTEDLCPGVKDFQFAAEGKGAFESLGSCEVIGFVSCGGCPGKRAVSRAQMLKDLGAEAVALTSCITKGTPIGFPCPNKGMMLRAIRAKLGEDFPVLEYTHPSAAEIKAADDAAKQSACENVQTVRHMGT